MQLDIAIIGGQVLDGIGAPATRLDIGICGDRIEAVDDLSQADAAVTIDAAGRYVCPGFIDVHSHSDAYLLIEPSAPSKVFQGITTEVVGNCGASAAPVTGAYHMPSDWQDKPYPRAWSSVAEYRALLDEAKPGPNVALLVGHNALRAGVAGYDNRPVTASELAEMKRLLEQALDEGARGLSTGLIYPPGMFAPRGEIVELAKVAAARQGIYTSHMRSEGGRILEAIDEALSIGRDAGIRVEISHLKTSGRGNWGLIDAVLARIESARAAGVDVAADRYPYTCSSTDLDVVFPLWAQEGGRDVVLRRLRDSADRARLRADLQTSRAEAYWGAVIIGSTWHPDNRRFRGMTLADAARELKLDPADTVLHLVETDELRTGAFFAGMSEENMERILCLPYVMVGSDASLRSPTGILGQDFPHPRAYGSFPRYLRMVLDGKLVPLPEAVRKITSLPADHFRLKDRGRLARGQLADVVVFNPATIADTASYADPHHLATGIDAMVVNGVITLCDARLTGQRGGCFL